jgi:hypothetical protein
MSGTVSFLLATFVIAAPIVAFITHACGLW